MAGTTLGLGKKVSISAALAESATGALGCSPVELPAPAAPGRDVPVQAQHLGAIAPGRQWVVLDTPNDRARVEVITGTFPDPNGGGSVTTLTKELCSTPCATDLKKGKHDLILTSTLDERRRGSFSVDLG